MPKIYHAPKLPEYTIKSDNSSKGADELQVFGKVFAAYFETYCPEYSTAILNVLNRTGNLDVTERMTGLSEKMLQLDIECGTHLFTSGPESVKSELFDAESRSHQGKSSGIKLLQSWIDYVDSNSKARISKRLSEWLTREPTQSSWQLHDDTKQLKKDMGSMERMGAWGADTIFKNLAESAIDKVIKDLVKQPELIKDLTIPYAAAVKDSDHDIPYMLKELTAAARILFDSDLVSIDQEPPPVSAISI